jgi:transposase InsO family protein
MFDFLKSIISSLFRRIFARSPVEADIVALHHQVAVLRRQVGNRQKLTRWDRLLFAVLYHVQPRVLKSISIVRPETVVRWHRAGFRLYWTHKSRSKAGRPRVPGEVRALIREISIANPLWGAPRIHGELLKLGIDVSQSTVANYMVRGKHPPSQGWLTFVRNHADGITAIDLFIVPTISFRLLFGLVILDHDRRQIVHIAATYHPTAEWIARQIVEAFPWETAPDYLIRDRDSAYGAVFRRRVSAMGIRDRPVAPRSPWQNGYVERVIGSIRRDLLDHVIVSGEAHLRRLLRAYADYYNTYRTHLGLNKDTPLRRPVHDRGRITPVPKLGGLHHAYVRI